MPYVQHRDNTLYYESYGTGVPVVLLHGVGGNHASWFYQIEAWARKYQLITVDARGFGNSVDIGHEGRSAFTSDLLFLFDHLQIKKAVIVAQSMGGGTAADFTCRHPDRVGALVLADTLVWLDAPPDMAEQFTRVQAATENLTQSERVLGTTFRNAEPELSRLYLQIASFNYYNVKTLVGRQRRYQPEEIANTGVSTFFIVGEEDVLFPPKLVQMVHRKVAGSKYTVLPGAGHSAYFETPAAFNAVVEAWIDQHRGNVVE